MPRAPRYSALEKRIRAVAEEGAWALVGRCWDESELSMTGASRDKFADEMNDRRESLWKVSGEYW